MDRVRSNPRPAKRPRRRVEPKTNLSPILPVSSRSRDGCTRPVTDPFLRHVQGFQHIPRAVPRSFGEVLGRSFRTANAEAPRLDWIALDELASRGGETDPGFEADYRFLYFAAVATLAGRIVAYEPKEKRTRFQRVLFHEGRDFCEHFIHDVIWGVFDIGAATSAQIQGTDLIAEHNA